MYEGNWRQRLLITMAESGFGGPLDFLEAHPRVPLKVLAQEQLNASAVQLLDVAKAQAETASRFSWLAKDLLIRNLHEGIPSGWGGPQDVEFAQAVALWQSFLGLGDSQRRRSAEKVVAKLRSAVVPKGWLPEDQGDPVMEQIFNGILFDT